MTTIQPSLTRAKAAAREFLRHRDQLGKWTRADLLMSLGRSYEFPPGTPEFTGAQSIGDISAFIQKHAVEIQ